MEFEGWRCCVKCRQHFPAGIDSHRTPQGEWCGEPRKDYTPPSSDGIVKAVVNLRDIMLKPKWRKRHC